MGYTDFYSVIHSYFNNNVLIFSITFLAIAWWYNKYARSGANNLPPGPFRLPIIGSFYILRWPKPSYRMFLKLSEKYGSDVVSFKVGSRNVVVLNSYDAVRDALVKQADIFSSRPNHLHTVQLFFDGRGVVWQNGDVSKSLRRFTLSALRDLGVGKNIVEERILEECAVVSDVFRESAGKPITGIKRLLGKAISNIISALVFGQRFQYDDPEFIALLERADLFFRIGAIFSPEALFPILRFLPSTQKKWKDILKVREENDAFIRNRIIEHRTSFDHNNVRDLVDMYISVTEGHRQKAKIQDEDMFRLILDIYLAGYETTATSLDWAILYIMAFPLVQSRCQQEIDEVIGNRQIKLADRGRLPYVEATILEIQRLACTVAMTLPHQADEDTNFHGYSIPKHTIVLGNLYASLRDPKHWQEPSEFKPERFLDGQGMLKKQDAFIPFGMGPRICLGENLARMELFLFVTNLLRQFTFSKADYVHGIPDLGEQEYITRCAKPYDVVVNQR